MKKAINRNAAEEDKLLPVFEPTPETLLALYGGDASRVALALSVMRGGAGDTAEADSEEEADHLQGCL